MKTIKYTQFTWNYRCK